MIAMNYLRLGETEDAAVAADTARSLEPESVQSWFTLLKVHLRQKLVDKGIQQ